MNYGGNKEQYYNVLNTLGTISLMLIIVDYHYNVMPLDFAIDLPHPQYNKVF